MKYTLFIGRWSPFHNGHKYIIDSFVKNGKPVCVAIRDSPEKYPVSLRMAMIKSVYEEEMKSGLLKVIEIPDIETVAVGRKVGYSLVQVPEKIEEISGTKIRSGHQFDLPDEVKELLEIWQISQM
jgi:adenylylsulfate kinase